MYFYAGPAKILSLSRSLDERVIALVPNRRSTLFAVLKSRSFELWSIRPATRLALVERSGSSLSKYGENVSLAWAPDGSSVVVLTSTSHVLDYVLQARDQPADDSTPLNPPIPIEHITSFPPSAGEGFITPYASTSTSRHTDGGINLDSALDDVQGGQAGEAVKDGLFRYTYSSLGFGVDVTLNGIAKLGKGRIALPRGLGFMEKEGMSGSSKRTGLLLLVQDETTRQQKIVSVPYPLEPDHLVQEVPEVPNNLPSTIAMPTQTSTERSISGAGTSTRFGAGLLGALSGRTGKSTEESKRGDWVGLDADVEVNVNVVKWLVGMDITFPGTEEGEGIASLEATRTHAWYVARTTKGQVYLCRYHRSTASRRSISLLDEAEVPSDWQTTRLWPVRDGDDDRGDEVVVVSLNVKFGVYGLGFTSGRVVVLAIPRSGEDARVDWTIEQDDLAVYEGTSIGPVNSLAWTSDGCGLAVGWERGMGLWSISGRQTFFTAGPDMTRETIENSGDKIGGDSEEKSSGSGAQHLFWTAGNNELVSLAGESTVEMSILPIMRSTSVVHLDPGRSEQPLLIADDTIRIYRGLNWKPSALLDPQASPWQSVKVNSMYTAVQWPIRYCCLSDDGTLLSVAGRNGLVHWSSNTGRWKMFANEAEEASFSVKGGMVWYYHVLIVATESARGTEIRLYSRDQDLSHNKCLDIQALPHTVVTMTLEGSTLLVLTSDNTLYHYNVTTTRDTIRLVIVDSMSLQGLNPSASKVRALCGFSAVHASLGYDLLTSVIVLLAGNQLVVLEPKKGAHGGTRYESRLLSGGVDSFYTYSGKLDSLRRCVWASTSKQVVCWPDVTAHDTITLPCSECPIAILHEPSLIVTLSVKADPRMNVPVQSPVQEMGVVLYLPQWLEWFLQRGDTSSAHELAEASQDLPHFTHSLEILLRTTVEGKHRNAAFSDGVVRLLDCFPQGLDVAAAYARKTDVEHWGHLFELIGDPRELFERCLKSEPPKLDTASRYLIAIPQQSISGGFEIHQDTTRLLKLAFENGALELCEEILRFLDSVDGTGSLKMQSLEALDTTIESDKEGMMI